jgi:hypothetical protein
MMDTHDQVTVFLHMDVGELCPDPLTMRPKQQLVRGVSVSLNVNVFLDNPPERVNGMVSLF